MIRKNDIRDWLVSQAPNNVIWYELGAGAKMGESGIPTFQRLVRAGRSGRYVCIEQHRSIVYENRRRYASEKHPLVLEVAHADVFKWMRGKAAPDVCVLDSMSRLEVWAEIWPFVKRQVTAWSHERPVLLTVTASLRNSQEGLREWESIWGQNGFVYRGKSGRSRMVHAAWKVSNGVWGTIMSIKDKKLPTREDILNRIPQGKSTSVQKIREGFYLPSYAAHLATLVRQGVVVRDGVGYYRRSDDLTSQLDLVQATQPEQNPLGDLRALYEKHGDQPFLVGQSVPLYALDDKGDFVAFAFGARQYGRVRVVPVSLLRQVRSSNIFAIRRVIKGHVPGHAIQAYLQAFPEVMDPAWKSLRVVEASPQVVPTAPADPVNLTDRQVFALAVDRLKERQVKVLADARKLEALLEGLASFLEG